MRELIGQLGGKQETDGGTGIHGDGDGTHLCIVCAARLSIDGVCVRDDPAASDVCCGLKD